MTFTRWIPSRTQLRSWLTDSRREWFLFFAVCVLLSVLTYGRLVGDLGHRVFASNDDSSLFIFWFAHAADVVLSWVGVGSGERNLLYTTSMNYPAGVNGGWNTSVMGLAVPLVPVTLVWGPVVAYNVAIMCAPVACALAAAWAATQFVSRRPAFVAGIAYGFSTYVIAQSAGHLNLAFAVLPPLVVGFVERLVTGRGRTWMNGVLLGCVVGWQFYLSNELLAHTFLMAVVLLVVTVALRWTEFREGFRRIAVGGAGAVGVAVVCGLPLLITMFALPGKPEGPIRPHGIWNNDLLDPVTPGKFTLISAGREIQRVIGIDDAEIGGYLGWPWLLTVAVIVVVLGINHAMSARVRTFAVVAVVMFILSMGSPMFVNGTATVNTGPFRLVESTPVLENVLPMRMSVHVALMFALLLAIAWHTVRPRFTPLLAVATVLIALTTTSGTVETRNIAYPSFYDDAVREHIPRGSIVKMMPRPVASASPHSNESLVGQAVSGMWFKQVDGYFIGSRENIPVAYQSETTQLDEIMKDDAMPEPHQVREAVEELREKGVEYVTVTDSGAGLKHPASDIARAVSEVSNAHVQFVGGVYVIQL